MITKSIQPFTWSRGFPPASVTATQLLVNPAYVGTLDTGVSFSYWLQDSGGADLHSGQCALTSDQYNGWGSGDQTAYILACLLTNLGLTAAA